MKNVIAAASVLMLASGCAGVDRSAAIEACAMVATIESSVPNPSAGQPLNLPPGFPTIGGFNPREPDFIRPSEAELRTRIANARSRAAASGDTELQRLTDALRIVVDSDGRRNVAVGPVVGYCNRQGW